ncbi:DUF2306 domain-containing protein [Corallococcus carmarthensis]|uniref:DUF2306 domain-containing protein n=1 Tax=Corallococcus carmarthensis TaxID=2316728 RepID=A0A3A8KNS4_9BACT|nr:DUF2306 domain-containing protein [Corallococcus carmarthensis]RKH04062.1 DUF2306 domain-containing protein [Corallococcus carmarthensis]
MSLYLLARWLHIASGVVAFITLWLPLVARKGGALHRRVGWVYVGAMIAAAISALVISGWRFLQAPREQPIALFFVYIAVLSAASASMGVRVLRTKTRTGASTHPLDVGLSTLLLCMGLFTVAYGLRMDVPLLWGFGPVGILSGSGGLWYWLRPPQERMHWWFQHMGAMVASGIGTITAALVVNARHLGIDGLQLAVFLGPTVVGVLGLNLWTRYYRQRFARKAPAATGRDIPGQARSARAS